MVLIRGYQSGGGAMRVEDACHKLFFCLNQGDTREAILF